MLVHALCFLLFPLTVQDRRAVTLPEVEVRTSAPSKLRLELHDAGALVGLPELQRATRDLQAFGTQGSAADAALAFEDLEQRRSQFEMQRDGLLGSLRSAMQPPAGDDTRIEWLPDGHVAVLAESAQQEWVRSYLAQHGGFDGMVDLKTVLWTLPAGPAANALVERNRERLGAAQAVELDGRLQTLGGERVTAPSILTFGFTPVQLSAGEELSYVADWEFLELTDGEEVVPAPVVESAFDGFELRATCQPKANDLVELQVDLVYRRLVRPIASRETTFAGHAQPVVVQLPEWNGVRIEGQVELATDETLLLAAEDSERGEVVLALLSARTVPALRTR